MERNDGIILECHALLTKIDGEWALIDYKEKPHNVVNIPAYEPLNKQKDWRWA